MDAANTEADNQGTLEMQHLSCCWGMQALQEEFDTERTDMADLMTAMEGEFAEADSEARQEFEAARE